MPSIHILIVDDDRDDIDVFIEAAKDVNPNVVCTPAPDCHEGLKLLVGGLVVDFIFLDLNTPKMNGFQCLTELKKYAHLKHIPTIIYTTSSRKEDREQALGLGATAFIVKPHNYTELKPLIEYALSHQWEIINQMAERKTRL